MQFADEADKSVYYEQSRVRKSTALYNLMTYLPNKSITTMNKLFSDTKVEIKSDNIYLPKITANGVPIYDSLRASKLVIVFRNFEVLAPLLIGLHIHNPGTMLIASAATYLLLYRPSFGKFLSGFVLKMELAP